VTDLLTIDEVAGLLRLSAETVRKLVRTGQLPAYRVAGRLRINRSAICDYLRRCETGSTLARPPVMAPRRPDGSWRRALKEIAP
jgi:excisionase family DNA binding protein